VPGTLAGLARLQPRLTPHMAVFEFKNAQELGRVCQHHGVKYLFFGKSGAIYWGIRIPLRMSTFMWRRKLSTAGNRLTAEEQQEIRRGKDFIQLRNGPFDLDLIFAPDGIERFDDAWKRRVEKHGLPIAKATTSYGANRLPISKGWLETQERVQGTRADRGAAPPTRQYFFLPPGTLLKTSHSGIIGLNQFFYPGGHGEEAHTLGACPRVQEATA